MNKRQKKKKFKQTHAGFSPETWSMFEENRKRWEDSIIFREYANLLNQGLSIPAATKILKERHGIVKEELYL